jgi:hypothetical protein
MRINIAQMINRNTQNKSTAQPCTKQQAHGSALASSGNPVAISAQKRFPQTYKFTWQDVQVPT